MKMSMEYPCVYFEKDGKCRKFSDDTVISYCVMGPCQEQTLSNADRIRTMSDEELADFIDKCEGMGYVDSSIARDKNGHCIDMLDWLRSPAEEDT